MSLSYSNYFMFLLVAKMFLGLACFIEIPVNHVLNSCVLVQLMKNLVWNKSIIEGFRFKDKNDYEYKIFS